MSLFLTLSFQIAKKLKLKLNEVNFYEPFMEEPVTIPGKPYIESELVDYIEQHDRSAGRRERRDLMAGAESPCVVFHLSGPR